MGLSAQGPKGDQGESGNDGIDGKDGDTPYIGENGNWWIGGSDTGVRAAEYGGIPFTGGLVYGVNGDRQSYYVADYTGKDRYVYIPEKYLGYPVTSIGIGAFKDNQVVQFVEANHILVIENNAFENTTQLNEVYANKLEKIEKRAFFNSSIKRFVFPNSLVSIGIESFQGSSIEQVEFGISTNINSIGDRAFATSVYYPYNDYRYSFSGTRNLNWIIIPESVENLGIEIFGGQTRALILSMTIPKPGWSTRWNVTLRYNQIEGRVEDWLDVYYEWDYDQEGNPVI